MRHYETLAEYDRDGFKIIVDKTWEDMHPSDCFGEGWDIDQLCQDIDSGRYDWFQLRIRVMVEGVELADAVMGGCMYEDARQVLTDGIAEDMIWDTMHEAKKQLTALAHKFTLMAIKHSERAVS